uniref:Uncharacterized protein n=1 Tax=Arion vulgaris TaxID=1028688 RepID=A0A0B6ZTC4_9EUPU
MCIVESCDSVLLMFRICEISAVSLALSRSLCGAASELWIPTTDAKDTHCSHHRTSIFSAGQNQTVNQSSLPKWFSAHNFVPGNVLFFFVKLHYRR